MALSAAEDLPVSEDARGSDQKPVRLPCPSFPFERTATNSQQSLCCGWHCQGWKQENICPASISSPRKPLVVSFVSASKMMPDFISLGHVMTLSFWQGHQTISLLWLSFGSDFRKPKGPLHLWAHGLQFNIFCGSPDQPRIPLQQWVLTLQDLIGSLAGKGIRGWDVTFDLLTFFF